MKAFFYIFTILLVASCHTTKPVVPTPPTASGGSEAFYAHRWVVTEIMGQPVIPAGSDRDANLLFYPGQVNKVSGSTGCNRLNGTFELSGVNKIKFSPLATTRMACPNGGDTEARFLEALGNVNNYYFSDSNLMLLNAKMLVVKLSAAPVAEVQQTQN